MQIIDGDLFSIYKDYDVITHGCNCFCAMKSGIAPQMAKKFGCDRFSLEDEYYCGHNNKLGQIDYALIDDKYYIVNSYIQYSPRSPSKYGIPLDYDALTLCMRKIQAIFPNMKILMPMIGCGLAGGDPDRVINIIREEIENATIVVRPNEFTHIERTLV